MKKVIISLLGTSVYDKKSSYENNTDFNIKNGEFINSIHAFLESFSNDKFIFLGSKEAMQKHNENELFKKLFTKNDVTFEEIDTSDLNDIFIKIMHLLINNQDKEILFDITHSFRDTVIMSVISTLVSQSVYISNIAMIYAKDMKNNNDICSDYRYETVSKDILGTSNIAFILTSFLNTLKVPPLVNTELYSLLNDFSTHLISNQFKTVYESDIGNLEDYIKKYKNELFFVAPLFEELSTILTNIKETKEKANFEKFLFFSKFFHRRDYFLQSATYLIEAITYYIGYVFKELKYIDFEINEYENQQKIVKLLRLNYKSIDFCFPNDYFIDINIDAINRFNSLRNKIANIRHNLAHINIEKEYGNLGNELDVLIKEFKNLIGTKVLYSLDKKDNKKIYTVKYKLEQIVKKSKSLVKVQGQNLPKLETLMKKHNENTINDLTQLDISKTKIFMKKYSDELQKLFELEEKRELLQTFKIPAQEKQPYKTECTHSNYTINKNGIKNFKKTKNKPKGINASKEKLDDLAKKFNS